MPGTFSPPPRVSDPDMHHGTCVTHVPWYMPGSLTSDFLWRRWRGKRSRHYRHTRNPQFCVSGKRPITHCIYWLWPSQVIYHFITHLISIFNVSFSDICFIQIIQNITDSLRLRTDINVRANLMSCCLMASIKIAYDLRGYHSGRIFVSHTRKAFNDGVSCIAVCPWSNPWVVISQLETVSANRDISIDKELIPHV